MTDGGALPLFPEDSHVNRSAMPGSEQAQMMTATSGRRCFELFTNSGHCTSWQKTFLDCFLSMTVWYSRLCYLTWNLRDTPYSRSIIRLRASEPTTDETGCSLWATPAASISWRKIPDGSQWNGQYWKLPDGTKVQTDLTQQVKMWPTPTQSDGQGGGRRRETEREGHIKSNLRDVIKMWPTPTTPAGHADGRIQEWALNKQTRERLIEQHGKELINGQLNPTWVEWLMGFPSGWTDCEHSEMP